jgi:uncharacterized repeat protein (TIGR01451 family)
LRRPPRYVLVLIPIALGLTATAASTAFAHRSTVRDTVYNYADLAVTVQPGPPQVTVGMLSSFEVSVVNNGPVASTSTTVTDKLPGGVGFVSASPSQGGCAQASGTVVCSLGALPVGSQALVTVVVAAPSAPGPLLDRAHAHASQFDPDTSNNTGVATADVVGSSRDFIGSFVQPSGDRLSTGAGTGRRNPQSTSAAFPATPIGVPAWISETSTTNTATACGAGYVCFGQVVNVAGFSGITAARPVRISMRFDSSEIPASESISTAILFRNRAIVPNCFSTSGGTAAPDPCIVSRTVLTGGDWKIAVRASRTGKFRLE